VTSVHRSSPTDIDSRGKVGQTRGLVVLGITVPL
jgi:hypothetical protein